MKETKVKTVQKKEEKSPELTERQKFHKWYREEYLKDVQEIFANGDVHNADKHGILGYVNICHNCTIDRPSAKEEYEKSKDN